MNTNPQATAPDPSPTCSVCRAKIAANDIYHHGGMTMCEACCITLRTPRMRKPHWQYIRSVKTEYLVPGKAR